MTWSVVIPIRQAVQHALESASQSDCVFTNDYITTFGVKLQLESTSFGKMKMWSNKRLIGRHFGKLLCSAALPGMYDHLTGNQEHQSTVIVVSSLIAWIEDK